MSKEKSFLDIYLDNYSPVKKKTQYFTSVEEQAIVDFNSVETTEKEKVRLFNELIEPAFRETIKGVLEMPKFHYLGKINRDDLIDSTFYRMVEKMHKFKPGMVSKKTGLPVKAFSYFSTVAKNYILEVKLRWEKVLKHKADVETSIDLSILSQDTLEKLSTQDKDNISFDNNEQVFKETSLKVINIIDEILKEEELKEDKKDLDLLKIGYTLKYLIKKWDKVDFMKKNEFMRMLALYTCLKQQRVSLLFKKFKIAVLEELNPGAVKSKNMSTDDDDDDEEKKPKKRKKLRIVGYDENNEEILESEEDDLTEEQKLERDAELAEEEKKSKINGIEDFEIYLENDMNNKFKSQWHKK